MNAVGIVKKHLFKINRTMSESLSRDTYISTWYMAWEGIKNGWDSGSLLWKRLDENQRKHYKIRVSVQLIQNHPLSPKGTAMMIMDNGEGVTEKQVEGIENLGRKKADRKKTSGKTDAHGLGRLALFGAMLDDNDP